MAKQASRVIKRTSKKGILTANNHSPDTSRRKDNRERVIDQFSDLITKALGNQPLAAVIGLLAAGSLIASISYNLGYLFTIDYRLTSLFTVQDVISSSLRAVPLTAIFITLGALFNVALIDLKNRRIASIRIPTLTTPRGKLNFIRFYGAITILMALPIPFISWRALFIFYVVIFALFTATLYLMTRQRRSASLLFLGVTILLILLLPFAVVGAVMASRDLNSNARDYQIIVNDKSFDVILLMASADVLIVRDDPRIVRIIPRSSVSEIKIMGVSPPLPWLSLKGIWNSLFPTRDQQHFHGR